MNNHTTEYDRYMRSDAWSKKRAERLELDNNSCVMCGRTLEQIKSIQVHHITYKNLGNENVLEDICTLCGSCHKKIHNFYKRKRA